MVVVIANRWYEPCCSSYLCWRFNAACRPCGCCLSGDGKRSTTTARKTTATTAGGAGAAALAPATAPATTSSAQDRVIKPSFGGGGQKRKADDAVGQGKDAPSQGSSKRSRIGESAGTVYSFV
jgi:hypothetical protein